MNSELRLKCTCGEVINGTLGSSCPKCHKRIELPQGGLLYLYRKGSPIGIASGFGLYLNGQPYGYIGNKETLRIPLAYGSYNIHVACGMNRGCNDIVVDITPENPFAYMKVWMRPGFWTNSFVLEYSTPDEMPNK